MTLAHTQTRMCAHRAQIICKMYLQLAGSCNVVSMAVGVDSINEVEAEFLHKLEIAVHLREAFAHLYAQTKNMDSRRRDHFGQGA